MPDTGGFYSLPYTEKTSALLEQMQNAGQAENVIREAEHCLTLGSIRPDWTAGKSVLEQQIQNAKSTRERNYWMCMKKIAESS